MRGERGNVTDELDDVLEAEAVSLFLTVCRIVSIALEELEC